MSMVRISVIMLCNTLHCIHAHKDKHSVYMYVYACVCTFVHVKRHVIESFSVFHVSKKCSKSTGGVDAPFASLFGVVYSVLPSSVLVVFGNVFDTRTCISITKCMQVFSKTKVKVSV